MIAKLDPLDDWDNLPISHTRIGYDNLLTSATSAEVEKAILPNTYERWEDASGAMDGVFATTGANDIDFVGIAAHNLFTANATQVEIYTATVVSGPYTLVDVVTITSNKPIMSIFDKVEDVVEVKISVPNDGSVDREIGVVTAGLALQMYQPIYSGFSSFDMSNKTEYRSNISTTGNFLGREIIKQGSAPPPMAYDNLDPNWVREKFKPFIASAETKPFFVKWRPDLYPDEVGYCQTMTDIKPVNMGAAHGRMSVSFSVMGHSDL